MSLNLTKFNRLPWRTTGRVITIANAQNCDEALKEIGGNFNVARVPLQTLGYSGFVNGVMTQEVTIPRAYANIRTDINSVVGIVGDRYRVLQNTYMAEWFKPWVDSGEVALHSGGVLDGGAKIWFLAEIQRPTVEVVKGDKISKFLIFSNSHDGTGSIKVGFLAVRIYCTNMLARLHRMRANAMIRIRHGAGAMTTLNEIQQILQQADEDYEEQIKEYQFLASKKLKRGDLELYVKTLLNEAETSMADLSTRKLNILKDIVDRCVNGAGQKEDGVAGTYWAAYNGYNEYLNYKAGNNENNRLSSLFNETENVKALKLAYQLASAA